MILFYEYGSYFVYFIFVFVSLCSSVYPKVLSTCLASFLPEFDSCIIGCNGVYFQGFDSSRRLEEKDTIVGAKMEYFTKGHT